MASCIPERARAAVAVLGMTLAATCAAAAADSRHEPIKIQAASTDVDFRTHQAVLRDVVISQGEFTLTADRAEATALEFSNSHWVFTGNVHIRAEQHGTLHSDRAAVDFRNNQMARAIVTGKPAEFEQTSSDNGILAHGHADSIDYEVGAGTVQLTDDAWLANEGKEISAPLIVWDMRQQQVHSESAPGQRVHVVIVPNQDGKRDGKP
jgi:lipopolysaccharide transport protein LptA